MRGNRTDLLTEYEGRNCSGKVVVKYGQISRRKLNNLSEQNLIKQTKEIAIEEKRKSRELLAYLAEMDRRGLWGKMGFSSVFNFLVKGLRYSEGEASYRARAMRLISSSSVAADKIQKGELGLAQAAKLQLFFSKDANGKQMNQEQKDQLINEVAGHPTSMVEKMLKQKSANDNKKIKLILNENVSEKFEKVKKMYAGEEISNEKLVEILLDEKIRQTAFNKPHRSQKDIASITSTNRYIPRQLKETIFQRSGAMCEYISPLTEQRCQERTHLQVDHILPLSREGKTQLNNLRILCSGHNASESKIQLGGDFIAKMKSIKLPLNITVPFS